MGHPYDEISDLATIVVVIVVYAKLEQIKNCPGGNYPYKRKTPFFLASSFISRGQRLA